MPRNRQGFLAGSDRRRCLRRSDMCQGDFERTRGSPRLPFGLAQLESVLIGRSPADVSVRDDGAIAEVEAFGRFRSCDGREGALSRLCARSVASI